MMKAIAYPCHLILNKPPPQGLHKHQVCNRVHIWYDMSATPQPTHPSNHQPAHPSTSYYQPAQTNNTNQAVYPVNNAHYNNLYWREKQKRYLDQRDNKEQQEVAHNKSNYTNTKPHTYDHHTTRHTYYNSNYHNYNNHQNYPNHHRTYYREKDQNTVKGDDAKAEASNSPIRKHYKPNYHNNNVSTTSMPITTNTTIPNNNTILNTNNITQMPPENEKSSYGIFLNGVFQSNHQPILTPQKSKHVLAVNYPMQEYKVQKCKYRCEWRKKIKQNVTPIYTGRKSSLFEDILLFPTSDGRIGPKESMS